MIPAGGRGTRMLSLTGGGPKELLPVAGLPVLIRVLRECAASGITEALIVIAPDKQAIIDLVGPIAGTDEIPLSVRFVVQHEPRGLADAIRLGRDFAGTEPLAVALPDNLFTGDEPALRQVIDGYSASGKNMVAVVEISAAEATKRGPTAIYPGVLGGDRYDISSIPEKRERSATFTTGGADSAFTGVGRFVFNPDVFDAIDETEQLLGADEELDDVPLMRLLLARGQLVGCRVRGRFFDVGLVDGFRDADEELARARVT